MSYEYVKPNAVARSLHFDEKQKTIRFSFDREHALRLALALTNAVVDPQTNKVNITIFKKDKNVMVRKQK